MSDGFAIQFDDNWVELSQRLRTFGDKVANQVTVAALKESALYMKHEAILYANKSKEVHKLLVKGVYIEITPGNLKDKIRYARIRKNRLEPGEVGYRVYVAITMAWYAKFLEFGTSNMAAIPFMRPAFENNYQNISRIFKEMIDIAILEGGFA
jgi:HK97 gp10 family phage protein